MTGCVLVDLGGRSTSVAIFQGGKLRHTATLRFAGGHVTSGSRPRASGDPGRMRNGSRSRGAPPTRRSVPEGRGDRAAADGRAVPARQGGAAAGGAHHADAASGGSGAGQRRSRPGRAGRWRGCPAGVVLTGGEAATPGIVELTRDVFASPVRVGVPADGLRGLVDRVASPGFAVPVGLALYGARQVALGGGFGAGGRTLAGGRAGTRAGEAMAAGLLLTASRGAARWQTA